MALQGCGRSLVLGFVHSFTRLHFNKTNSPPRLRVFVVGSHKLALISKEKVDARGRRDTEGRCNEEQPERVRTDEELRAVRGVAGLGCEDVQCADCLLPQLEPLGGGYY